MKGNPDDKPVTYRHVKAAWTVGSFLAGCLLTVYLKSPAPAAAPTPTPKDAEQDKAIAGITESVAGVAQTVKEDADKNEKFRLEITRSVGRMEGLMRTGPALERHARAGAEDGTP